MFTASAHFVQFYVYVYCIQCTQCFISLLYVFFDVCAFDTYNKLYLVTLELRLCLRKGGA